MGVLLLLRVRSRPGGRLLATEGIGCLYPTWLIPSVERSLREDDSGKVYTAEQHRHQRFCCSLYPGRPRPCPETWKRSCSRIRTPTTIRRENKRSMGDKKR